ncbi:MAG: hypothetical protein IPM39_29420 [Chloroflexi bacterium]|nr:hypothetical protein [Chloroflexota bacterium]
MEDNKKKVRPFSNGSQYGDWLAMNCMECAKGIDNVSTPGTWPTCEIEAALTLAYASDGYVEPDIATRMDHNGPERLYVWRCGEYAERPSVVDGKVVVDDGRHEGYVVWNHYMMLLDTFAVVGQANQSGAAARRSPHGYIAELQADGHEPLEPVRLYEAAVGPDMVEFQPADGRCRFWLNMAWYAAFYEAGLSVALAKIHGREGVMALLANGDIVGAVRGLSPNAAEFKRRYSVLWEDAQRVYVAG